MKQYLATFDALYINKQKSRRRMHITQNNRHCILNGVYKYIYNLLYFKIYRD